MIGRSPADIFGAPYRRRRRAAATIAILLAACGGTAYCLLGGQPETMTLEQALEAARHAPEVQQRRSAVAAAGLHMLEAVRVLRAVAGGAGEDAVQARLALERIHRLIEGR